MVKFRIEQDSLGEVKVPSNKLWGAQTQRSVENFKIGVGKFHFQDALCILHHKQFLHLY